MTIVVAKKYGERIVVLSDTMISHERGARSDIFPGRLKSIVVNQWLTVAYAGLSNQAISELRDLGRNNALNTSDVVSKLLSVNVRFDNEVEFIVCSHETRARLIKISRGRPSEGGDAYWIGCPAAASNILAGGEKQHFDIPDLPDYLCVDEMHLFKAFRDYLNVAPVEQGVGGAAVYSLCSEHGHCYQTAAGAMMLSAMTLGVHLDQHEYDAKDDTGMHRFAYTTYAPNRRGVAVVGLHFSQSNTGYLYDPLGADSAMRVAHIDAPDFVQLIEHAAVLRDQNHA